MSSSGEITTLSQTTLKTTSIKNNNSNTATITTNPDNNGNNKEDGSNNNGGGDNPDQQAKFPGFRDFPQKLGTTTAKSQTKDKFNSSGGKDRISIHFNHLEKLLEQMKKYLTELKTSPEDKRAEELKALEVNLHRLPTSENEDAPSTLKNPSSGLSEIRKKILKLNQQLISSLSLSKENSQKSENLQTSSGSNGGSGVSEFVNVHKSAMFRSSSFYREIQDIFNGLDDKKKFFLSCFTVFPENAVVKRSIFVYWGVGEEWLKLAGEEESPEKIVDVILEEFQEKGLIEPAIKKRKQPWHVKSYRMDPLVRSAVTLLSKEANYFDYDGKGNVLPQLDWTSGLDFAGNPLAKEGVPFQRSQRLCLQKGFVTEKDERRKFSKENKIRPEVSETELEKVLTLFNINEPFPDLQLAGLTKLKDENAGQMKEPSAVWFSKMKSARVVCLGSWPGSAKSHIEVQSREFLKGLTSMENLRFLSLRGISRITFLPHSIGNLSNLLILDLKECHNLEILSVEIVKLKKLGYLDVSDCYLLADMPKGLGALSELQVLKGFVISNRQNRRRGTLDDLKGLKKLRKLTVNARSEDFPTGNDLSALQDLGKQALQNLTIVWGPAEPNKAPKVEAQIVKEDNQMNKKLPEQLEKLVLQCFPKSTATWLTPGLPKLEKLYIRGGNLATLDLYKSEWSKVKTLHLKYLSELKINWRELRKSFPKLEYLEKVKCPGITLCPCDEHGVWMKTI